MNRTGKIVLSLLVAITSLSVWSFFGSLKNTTFRIALPAQIAGKNAALPPPETDSDHDGLSDVQEAYWNTDFQDADTDRDGFKDGEEVTSGHDPTTPGPDDKITLHDEPQNITTKMSGLVLAGLSEGSLRADSPKLDVSVEQIVDDVFQQYTTNLGQINGKQIVIVGDSTAEILTYRGQIIPLLKVIAEETPKQFREYMDMADMPIDNPANPVKQFLEREESILEGYIRQLENHSVPAKWQTSHFELLATLRVMQKTYPLIYESGQKNDIVQAGIAISYLSKLQIAKLYNLMRKYHELVLLGE